MKALLCAGLAAVALTQAYADGYRVNLSDSMPMGFWQVRPAEIRRGSIVLACPPDTPVFRDARAARYLGYGTCPGGFAPLLKPVAALPGDHVAARRSGVRVNGHLVPHTGRIPADGAGRRLPSDQDGEHTVAANTVWLLSSYNPASFDSRYFGPVRASRIQGVARPVFVVGARS